MKRLLLSMLCLLTLFASRAATYQLVESTSDINQSNEYILVSGNSGNVSGMGTIESGKTFASAVDGLTVENKRITTSAGLMSFKFVDGSTAGTWRIKVGDNYLGVSTDSNAKLALGTSVTNMNIYPPEVGTNGKVQIEYSTVGSKKYLQFNNASNPKRFANYSGQQDCYLFKLVTGGDTGGTGGGGGSATDKLNVDLFKQTLNISGSAYTAFTYTAPSTAVYKGETQTNNSLINLTNAKGTNYRGIFVTSSTRNLKSVKIVGAQSGSTKSRSFDIYVSNSPFDPTVAPSGTAAASYTVTSTSGGDHTYTVPTGEQYKYFALVANGGALQLSSLEVEWEDAGSGSSAVDIDDSDFGWSAPTASAIVGEAFTAPTLTNTHGLDVTYSSSDPTVAEVDPATGEVTILKGGTTEIRAKFDGNAQYNTKTVSYTLTVQARTATPVFVDNNENPLSGTVELAIGTNLYAMAGDEDLANNVTVTYTGVAPTISDNGTPMVGIVINGACVLTATSQNPGELESTPAVLTVTIPIVASTPAPTVTFGGGTDHKAPGEYSITKAQTVQVEGADGTTLTFAAEPADAITVDDEMAEINMYSVTFSKNCTFTVTATEGSKEPTTLTYTFTIAPNPNATTILVNGEGEPVSGSVTVAMGTILEIENADATAKIAVSVKEPGQADDITIDEMSSDNDVMLTVNNPCTIVVATTSGTYADSTPIELVIYQQKADAPIYLDADDNQITDARVTMTPGTIHAMSTETGATTTVSTPEEGDADKVNYLDGDNNDTNGTDVVTINFNGSLKLAAVAKVDGMIDSDPVYLEIEQPQVADPVFTPEAGAVAAGTEVTIACDTEDAQIMVSTDGENFAPYSSAIAINSPTTLHAYATKTGYIQSQTVTAAYTVSQTRKATFDFTHDGAYGMVTQSGQSSTYNTKPYTCEEAPVTLVLADGNTRLWVNNNNYTLKHYKGNTFTLSVDNGKITKVTFDGDKGNIGLAADQPGEWNSSSMIWTGNAETVVFKSTQSSGGKDVRTIDVEYELLAEPAEMATVSFGGTNYANGSEIALTTGQALTITPAAGTEVSFPDLPAGVTVGENEGMSTLTFTAAGTYTIKVKASADGKSDAIATYTVVVEAPVIPVTATPELRDNANQPVSGRVETSAGTVYTLYTTETGTVDYTISVEPESAAVVATTGGTTTITVNASCAITVTAQAEGKLPSEAATLTANVFGANQQSYTLVNDASQIEDDERYILAYVGDNNEPIVMGLPHSGGTYFLPRALGAKYAPAAEGTAATITIDDPANVAEFTLLNGSVDDRYALRMSDGKYIVSGDNITTLTTDDNPADAEVSLTNQKNVKIVFDNNTGRILQYDAQTGKFLNTTGKKSPTLYRLVDNTRVERPELTITAPDGTAPATAQHLGQDFYVNRVVVKPASRNAESYVYSYSEDEPREWSAMPVVDGEAQLEVNVGGMLYVKGTAAGLTDSKEASHPMLFRPAAPTYTESVDTESGIVTLTIATATEGATIEWSSDGGANWSLYTDGTQPTFGGINVTHQIRVRVTKEGYTLSTIYDDHEVFVKGPNNPFELVTDASTLAENDDIIIVARDSNYAMAPYVSDNNCKTDDISTNIADKGTKPYLDTELHRIYLPNDYSGIEVLSLKKNGSYWRLLCQYTTTGGQHDAYLTSGTTTNKLTATVSPNDNANAVITNLEKDGEAHGVKILFQGTGNRKDLRYNTSKLFACYTDGNMADIEIYRRVSANRVARPHVSPKEGFRSAAELAGGVTITCDTEGATIWYTTDGTEPIIGPEGADWVSAHGPSGLVVNEVGEGTTIRAVATYPGMANSLTTIAAYHVFTPNRVFTRVAPEDIQNLNVNDEVIIVASPTGDANYYAMGRLQTDEGDGEGQAQHRQAIRLNNRPDANGNLILESSQIQPFRLISGVDDYEGFNWRLYASGTKKSGVTDEIDGYLYSAGGKNSLVTKRIDNDEDPMMPNADVRFLSYKYNEIGNEYGGVTVQFGSPDGHEESYPNYLALTEVDGVMAFNCYRLTDINDPTSPHFHVSIFKAYDPTAVAAPHFAPLANSMPVDDEVTLGTVTPDARIYYRYYTTEPDEEPTIDTEGWILYTEPIVMSEKGNYYFYSYATADGLTPSAIASHTYRVARDEVFELVTTGTELRPSDRFIIVTATPYADPRRTDDPTTPRYYAMGKHISGSGSNPYHEVIEVEEVPTEAGAPRRMMVLDGSDVAVIQIEPDGAELVPSRPWLFEMDGKYLKATEARVADFVELPTDDHWMERSSFSAHAWVDNYANQNIEYGPPSYSDKTGQLNYNSKTQGTMNNAAHVMISATEFNDDNAITKETLLHARFNPVGNYAHFNFYDADNQGSISSTFPVQVYRATENVLPPSLTIYPIDLSKNLPFDDPDAYSENAISATSENMYNPVKIVVKENLKSNRNAKLSYLWGPSLTSSEYEPAPDGAKELVFYADGFNVKFNGDNIPVADLHSTQSEWLQTAFRAMSSLGEGDNARFSRCNPRSINFKTVAPRLTPLNDERTRIEIGRPETNWTAGAALYYTTDGTRPSPSNGTLLTLVDGKAQVTIQEGDKLWVGAFKDGYEPSYNDFKQFSYYPDNHPTQIVELIYDGLAQVNAGEDGNKYTMMTVCPDEDTYYALGYDSDQKLIIKPLPFATGVNVMKNPDNFNWTADFFVIGLDAAQMKNTLETGDVTVDIEKLVIEGQEITEPLTYIDSDNNEHIGYCALIKRHGKLGTDQISSSLYYTVTDGDKEPEAYVTTVPAASITPIISAPYGMTYKYVTVRDTPMDYTREDHFQFNTSTSIAEMAEYMAEQGADKMFNTVNFHKDLYTLRHINCEFNFRRPNVCKDIIDNYDIVYDITMQSTDSEIPDINDLYADFSRTEPDYSLEKHEDYLYSFVINDVTPFETFNPVLKINKVTYYPNGDNDGYSELSANYPKFNDEGKDVRTGVTMANSRNTYRQILEGANENKAATPDLSFEMAYNRYPDAGDNEITDWIIMRHVENSSTDPTIGTDQEAATLQTPFMYHVEAIWPGHPETYYSHDFLVQHDRNECAKEGSVDPFAGLVIGHNYPAFYENKASQYTAYPKIYVTPIYFFARDPQPSVQEEGNLEIFGDGKTTVDPNLVRRRAARAEAPDEEAPAPGIYDENNPLIVRGSTHATFQMTTESTPTGVEEVEYQGQGDIEYFNLMGIRVDGDKLPTGVYIRRQGDTSTKVLIK